MSAYAEPVIPIPILESWPSAYSVSDYSGERRYDGPGCFEA